MKKGYSDEKSKKKSANMKRGFMKSKDKKAMPSKDHMVASALKKMHKEA